MANRERLAKTFMDLVKIDSVSKEEARISGMILKLHAGDEMS